MKGRPARICVRCGRRRRPARGWRKCWQCGELTCGGECSMVHEMGHNSAVDQDAIEASFRDAWPREFPGDEWPGLAEAQRRIRERYT